MVTHLPALVFVCGHLCDERLFAAQVSQLSATHDCRVFAFREHDSLAEMADELLHRSPSRFSLVGLSMGGYVAFEVLRRAPERLSGLALLDTTAAADTPERSTGRVADIERVKAAGMGAFAADLPKRWLAPANAHKVEVARLVREMAVAIGPEAQRRQQKAIAARVDSFAVLDRVEVPTLVACGRLDMVTPVRDHEQLAEQISGARLDIIEDCGHLSTIEQPRAVNALLASWLAAKRFP